MLKFCKLEKDVKSFEYTKKYFQMCKNNKTCSLFGLDDVLQNDEIKEHCQKRRTEDALLNEEAIYWIDTYGSGFRIFLNTIKMLVVLIHCSENIPEVLTWEEFCKYVDTLNKFYFMIETIF
jgi:hypothetical protein